MSEGVRSISVSFGAPVEISAEHQQRLVSLVGEICDAYEDTHADRTMWPAGIGGAPSGLWGGRPEFDMSVLSIDCCERERFEDEERYRSLPYAKQVIADAIDRIGWPEIDRFQAELRQGKSIDEDAGGFMLRAIGRLFGIRRRRDPVVTYQDAARALFEESKR
jgi:hypothetical protein